VAGGVIGRVRVAVRRHAGRSPVTAPVRVGGPAWRIAALLICYLVLWTGADWVAIQFPAAPGVSLWDVPAALDVLLLLLFGLRWAPVLAVTVVIHAYLIAPVGLRPWQVAILGLAAAVSYAAAAWTLTRPLQVDTRLRQLRDVAWLLLLTCGIAPLVVAAVQLALLRGVGAVASAELVSGALGQWAGSATAIAMLVPLVLIAARRRPRVDGSNGHRVSLTAGHRPGRWERAAQVVILLGAIWVGYGTAAGGSLDYSYLVYAPLIWISLRGGFLPAALAVLAINGGAVMLNHGQVPAQGGFALQLGLVSVTLLGILLGASVTQRSLDAEKNRSASLHDALTGIANRVLLADRLGQALAGRESADPAGLPEGGLLFLDLDRFKQINDSLGHSAGDEVLVEIGRRLRRAVRPADTVARWGGDEFAVLLTDVTGPDGLDGPARRLLEVLTVPIQLTAGLVHVTVSIGSSRFMDPAPDGRRVLTAEQVLHRADVALHQAKEQGRNRHITFRADQLDRARRRRDRVESLRSAVRANAITVAFQPIVAVRSGERVGAEALARWTLPGGRQVAPRDFIATAEESGLIIPLGHAVLRQACAAAAGWTGVEQHLRIAVNVSAIQLQQADYADGVLAVLEQTGLPAHRLELEITETQWLNEVATTTSALHALTAAGIKIVLDDFGTGYSSFQHLADMPVHGVKIDRSFIGRIPDDPHSAAIVRAILCMAVELGLETTAEGVETPEQWAFLIDNQVDRGQGFRLGRPAPELT